MNIEHPLTPDDEAQRERRAIHCKELDMTLMREVVELDLENLARRVREEHNVVIPLECMKEWRDRIVEALHAEVERELAEHRFLPARLNERIAVCARELLLAYLHPVPQPATS